MQQNPQHRPVVVIDGFLHKADHGTLLYDNIVKWATVLMEGNVAHVIFLTNDAGYSKALATDRVIKTVTLSDMQPDGAKYYVLRQLEYIEGEAKKRRKDQSLGKSDVAANISESDLDNCIRVLGGRIRDLEGFSQRLAMGVSPEGMVFKYSLLKARCTKRHGEASGLGNYEAVFYS